MAFLGESRLDEQHAWHIYACLNKKDCEIVLKAIGPVVGRYLRSYEYYKDILESGEATDKQTDALLKAEENFNTIIELRNMLVQYLKDF